MDAVTNVPPPHNEPVRQYPPGSPDRAVLESKVKELAGERAELTMTIGGRQRLAGGEPVDVVAPHNHRHVLGTMRNATGQDVAAAIDAAAAAAPAWRALAFDDRAAIMLKAADLLSGPWRATINAATILGQSKSVYQAEIDAACELIDFWRYNVHYARRLLAEQPESSPGVWNRMEYRPLEGFVLAITPFNFTSIAGNLPTAPALLGNVVVWKPSPTQQLAAHYTMRLLEAAGLPPGVINLVTGDGQAVSDAWRCRTATWLGIHFTGSTATFQHLWRTVGRTSLTTAATRGWSGRPAARTSSSRTRPPTRRCWPRRWSGARTSTRGRSAPPRRAPTCRASLWPGMRDDFLAQVESLTMGDVGADLSLFMGAVIDARAYAKHSRALAAARGRPAVRVLTGGQTDDSEGYFVQPTVLECSDPADEVFTTEYFGPILAVHVYDDARYDEMVAQAADVAPYALTGSVIAQDRAAIAAATGRAAVLGGQLLHQRQADRGGRRAAAVRRGAGQRHQRQGRVHLQPHPVGERPRHQGTVRPAGGLPLPAHGIARSGIRVPYPSSLRRYRHDRPRGSA